MITIGKLGKQPARIDSRTLKLEKYLVPGELPPVTGARDWEYRLAPTEATTSALGNTEWGCCAPAAYAHLADRMARLNGRDDIKIATDGVLEAYAAISGWDGTPATDNGCYLLDVAKHARNVGICGVKANAFLSFNVRNPAMRATAVELFGGYIVGLGLPTSAKDQDVWEVVPGMMPWSWGGHAVDIAGFSPAMVNGRSWGAPKDLTPAFEEQTVDEAYVFLFDGMAVPCGLDYATLEADLKLIEAA